MEAKMVGLSPIEQMPVIMLLVTIVVLFALSYLVTNIYLKGKREVTFEIKADSLDKQYLFWLGIIVPIGVFFYLEYFVFLSNEINFNSVGFKNFFNESKLPLGVLALSPIFGVIVSNIHRTIQTEKQIQETDMKNIIDGFYSHHKYVIEELKTIKEKNGDFELLIESPNRLYKKIYPTSNIKNGYNEIISNTFKERLEIEFCDISAKFNELYIYLNEIKTPIDHDFLTSVYNHVDETSDLMVKLIRYCHLDDSNANYLKKKKNESIDKFNEYYTELDENNTSFNEIVEYRTIIVIEEVVASIVIYSTTFILAFSKIFDAINYDSPNEYIKLRDSVRTELKLSFEKISSLRSNLYKPIIENQLEEKIINLMENKREN